MASVADDGSINPHVFTGWNSAIPYSPDYDQPVSENRRAFLSRLIEANFPGKTFEIVGAPWDHEHEKSGLNPDQEPKDAFIGHYLVRIQEIGDIVFQVEKYNAETALKLGAQFFEAAKEEGTRTMDAIPWPDGKYHAGFEGLSVHMTPFMGRARRLSDTKVEGFHAELGRLAAQLYDAGDKMIPNDLTDFERHTDIATFDFWRKGVAAFANKFMATESVPVTFAGAAAALPDIPGLETVLGSAQAEDIKARVASVMSTQRIPTAFNVIDKQIYVDEDKHELILACYDCGGRGYVPMMTEHATYDLGTIAHRILLNRGLYTGSAEEIDRKILAGIESFVEAYREETFLPLTVEETMEAARNAFSMLAMFACGSYVDKLEKDPSSAADALAHIHSNFRDAAQRIAEIDRLLALRNRPQPGQAADL